MRSTIRLLAVLASLASSLSEGVAFADDPNDKALQPKTTSAREHLSRGVRLYNTRSFEDAIKEFKEGSLIEPAPVFDYNLGQAYRHLGKYEDALWHYDRFLANAEPTGELLEVIQGFERDMREHLANRARTAPPTEAVSDTDSPRRPSGATVVAPLTTTRQAAPPQPAPGSDSSISWVGVTVTASGVLALGGAGLLFVNASGLNDDANAEPTARTRDDLRDRARTRNIIGAVVGAGGVVLTVTGIYMLASHRGRSAPQTAALDVGIGGGGVVVFGRF